MTNANENMTWLNNPNRKGPDDLGRIYGFQWRHWMEMYDQLGHVVHMLNQGKDDRRLIVTAWNPTDLKYMALPPCHLLFQFGIEPRSQSKDRLNLCMYQRSCDVPLGVPFNIASYSLLLHIVARITRHIPGTFTHFLWDCHIYANQMDLVKEQLKREPRALPKLQWSNAGSLKDVENLTTDDFALIGYNPHDSINYPFSV